METLNANKSDGCDQHATLPDIDQVVRWADSLRHKNIEEILAWGRETFGDGLAMMTALGYSGIVLLDHVRRIIPQTELYFIDTGFHFEETMHLLDHLRQKWGLSFNVIKPRTTISHLRQDLGDLPWKTNPNLCCHYMKVEPMLRVLNSKTAWLNALRRDQSPTRADIDLIELDGRGTLKLYPMAAWTREACWQYIRDHNLPYNVLHDKGYPSIGCRHCTAPIRPGEHERAGRWNSMPKLECGLHVRRRK